MEAPAVSGRPVSTEDELWKWNHNELGFFLDLNEETTATKAPPVMREPTESPPSQRTAAVPNATLSQRERSSTARLRAVLDELHVALDLLRWMARLRQLLLARARDALQRSHQTSSQTNGSSSPTMFPRDLLSAVPSGTRSDVANRLLELLQRGAAVWARRHAPSEKAAADAFAAAPPFLAEITYDLANFKPSELERLILAATHPTLP